LQREEGEVFGTTNKKSKIIVIFKAKGIEISKPRNRNDFREELFPKTLFNRSIGRIVGEDAGIAYLFSVIGCRPYIKPGGRFIIRLSGNKEVIKIVLSCLWCAIYLGNFGTRGRRGAGSLAVLSDESSIDEIRSHTNLDFILNKTYPEEILHWFNKNIETAVKIVNNGKKPQDLVTKYSNLIRSRMIISEKKFNSWKDALNEIGKIYENYRFNHRRDYLDVAVFGFPVPHKRFTVKGKLGNKPIDRRSSPLIFKVLKSGENYYWALIKLSGEFLPQGGIVTSGKQTQKPDYRVIDEFWNNVKNYGYEKILVT